MSQDELFTPYGAKVPSVRGSDTSEAAATSMEASANGFRAAVYREIWSRGSQGATCDEIEVALQMRHQTASARVRELVLLNQIIDTKRRRKTRSGRAAAVYVIRN